MKLPEKLKIPLTIVGEASTEGVINQLIDYLKEREEPHIYNTFSTEKPCTCGGRGARGEHGSPKCSKQPKKIELEKMMRAFASVYERADEKEKLKIINHIKDAIHENN